MSEAEKLEMEIMQKSLQLAEMRRKDKPEPVNDYLFETLNGDVNLTTLFAGRDKLLVIHNMGQGCRYCTLWADGINGVLDHLEDAMGVLFVSKDPPELQRRMALDRGWRFRMASHRGGAYMNEQCTFSEQDSNYPGAAVYELRDGKIFRIGRSVFGPGDLYSPVWHFLALGSVGANDWTPQFHYWGRPSTLDDGGEDIRD